MITICLFNLALIGGIAASQLIDLTPFRSWLFFLTDALLAYIMIEVGMEFLINKKKWKGYLIDYLVASLAAGLPWIFCFLYFFSAGHGNWEENLLLARFAAPTATGMLFAMLGVAGLGMTWLFKKIEVLVILDNLDTILFLIPLQFLLSGGRLELITVALIMIILLIIGWRYMHTLKLPASRPWLFCYALVMSGVVELLDLTYELEVEVLLPAFVGGLILYPPHEEKKSYFHEHAYIEPMRLDGIIAERTIKLTFMFLVGLLLPQLDLSTTMLKSMFFHVACITLLMNLGKLVPIFFYKKEATLRERMAVAVGLMPRGEVGAGILTIALGHGITNLMTQVVALSLVINLLLTGFFIWIVMWLSGLLTKSPPTHFSRKLL